MEPLFYSMQEIVIAVKDLDNATERLSEIFTAPADGLATEPLPGIDLLQRGIWIGNERIAIVADATGSGHVSQSIEKRGEGIHEICVRTRDLQKAIAHFKEKGVRLTRDEPYVLKNYEYRGEVFSEVRIVFIHPASCYGVLVEVQEWVK